MTRLLTKLAKRDDGITFGQWVETFKYLNNPYYIPQGTGSDLQQGREKIDASFQGYVDGIYKRNGVIFACVAARQLILSEAEFRFKRRNAQNPSRLWGDERLGILETPWENATTGDLITRMELDGSVAGNFFGVRRGDTLRRLRPDWVTIVSGTRSGSEVDTELLGYAYQPGGPASGEDPVVLLPGDVAHFAPLPDPLYRFRGMSWLGPVIEEIQADVSAMTHKLMYFQNGAVPSRVVTLDADISPDAFTQWIDMFEQGHRGVLNAYKTLYLGGGADAKVVGSDMRQVDFKVTQGHGETRICAAARVPPIIAGFSEGLEAATYSNYGQARRAFADLTLRPLWRQMAGALASVVRPPRDSKLWYDDRDIPFLQEDMKDAADIQQTEAVTIRELINSGFEPESVVTAVMAGNYGLLVHTGRVSVQLQDPAAADTSPQPDAPNGVLGNGDRPVGAGRALAALMAAREQE